MGLHVRTITPYALPGVLALLACWWFFSRKKDGCSTKRDHISACIDKVETDDTLEEIHDSSRAQCVQLDQEEGIVLKDCTYSLPLRSQDPLHSIQSRVEDDLVKESHLKTVQVGILQGFSVQEVQSSKIPDCFGAIEESEVQEVEVCTSSALSLSLDGNNTARYDSATSLSDVVKVCTVSTEPPCRCNNHEFPLKATNQQVRVIHDSDLLELRSQSEVLEDVTGKQALAGKEQSAQSCVSEIKADMSPILQAGSVVENLVSRETDIHFTEPSEFSTSNQVPACPGQNQIKEIPCVPLKQQSNEVCYLRSAKQGSHSEDGEITQSEKTSAGSVNELNVQPSVAETQVEVAGGPMLPRSQSMDDEIAFIDVKICKTQFSEIIPSKKVMQGNNLDFSTKSPLAANDILQSVGSVTAAETSESCRRSPIPQVVREDNCTNLLDAFSRCLEKNEEIENSCPVVDSLKEANTKTFLGDYEAKIVEQLAINIISKVIVAARQEILASSVSDLSESSCQVLDENRDVRKDTQGKQLVPESDEDSVSANLTLGLMDFDCTCESTQCEQLQNKDLRNVDLAGNEFCLEHQSEEKYKIHNIPDNRMQPVSDFSGVHRRTDLFEGSHPALGDSSLSVCTSEEGINMDDPLQSSVLTVSTGCYDSLSSSGIELSRESFNLSIEKPKTTTCGESGKEIYSNGDIKRGSPDLNNEGPLTAESEVDHSGGSDVNSMDSVDSGCALGNGEQFQNVKSDAKKADLVIWEFEVPKYLVGRLIGKQGRFVSFLKQSSGAKIYISTVPYTQDIQICHLEGTQQQIDRALNLIRKKFKDLNLTNIFAPPPPLIPLPVASWLTLPNNVSVEVVVVHVVNAGHMFVQQRTHPTFHALCGLDQHMSLCYSQPGIPTLPTPAEVGILCAAPVGPSVWWRAQVMAYFEDSEEVEILYVDYGGYNRVKIETLRQIRSDFVSLPFQGVEVLLDNVIPLGDDDHFSAEADAAVKELSRGAPMLTQVTNYDEATRLPLVQLWRLNPDEMVSVNRTLVERGFAEWLDGY